MTRATTTRRRIGRATLAASAALTGLIALGGVAGADVSSSTVTLSGTATSVVQGAASAAAAGWSITLPTNAAVGDELQFVVNPKGLTAATTSCSGYNFVSFASTPTASVSGNTGLLGGTLPTVKVSAPTTEAGMQAACKTDGVDNEVTVTVTAAGSEGLLGGSSFTVDIANVKYIVGEEAALGAVSMADSDYVNAGSSAKTLTVPSNATVLMGVAATANNPPIALTYGADSDQAISPIALTEGAPDQVTAGYVCVAIAEGSFDVTGNTPTVTVTTGDAVVSPTVTNPAANTLAFNVTTASAKTASTFTLGNLFVNGGTLLGPVGIAATYGNTATCTGGSVVNTVGVRAFSVLYPFRTAGPDADGTAVAAMETVFTPPDCPASKSVVLATDSNFPDALSASYLAGQLGTGILLTPTASLSTETADALQVEGIQNVYVVGGTLAVSQNVINQLEATPAYVCGGTAAVSPAQKLDVTTIAGQTQYDTSQDIATHFPAASVGTLKFPGAYGRYDNTTGTESVTGPTTAVPTAIMATGTNFEDASAASVLGYADKLPVILTDPNNLSSQAQSALTTLGIQQVILVGGPLAVSDTVVQQIEALNISLLRIAGQDYTDTAQELARFELSGASSSAGAEGLNWESTSDHVITLARGDFYSDALAGAPFAALAAGNGHPMPILLTFDPATLGQYLTGFLNAGGSNGGVIGDGAASEIDAIFALGGTQAIEASTLNAALTALAAG